jgi:DnaJ-class molecular chaperone
MSYTVIDWNRTHLGAFSTPDGAHAAARDASRKGARCLIKSAGRPSLVAVGGRLHVAQPCKECSGTGGSFVATIYGGFQVPCNTCVGLGATPGEILPV